MYIYYNTPWINVANIDNFLYYGVREIGIW